MKPLEPLSKPSPESEPSPVERLLREAAPADVRAELERLDALALTGAAAAARRYAHGALALREGRLDAAHEALEAAAAGLQEAAEPEAAALARCEAWLAAIRRGPRKVYVPAAEALERLTAEVPESRLVKVVATHYRATALRYSGRAAATLQVLLDAFSASEGLLIERAQVLNSLGTLYVVLGAYGAAESVLAHAAEVNHQIGDRVSEAISYGQLGSAAMALGDLDGARKYLQKQEWFASRVGDSFGQSRALVLLADVAIDLGRPDDAIELGEQARELAASVTPPLNMWVAYATRTIGRAKVELGDADAVHLLRQARERFSKIGNQLGEALVSWDLARWYGRTGGPRLDDSDDAAAARRRRWHATAWRFATLGLSARVSQVLRDLRQLVDDEDEGRAIELAIGAAAQSYAHLSTAQEVELVLSKPDTLAEIATRRIAGQRNLGRLAAHTLADGGLYVAVIAASAVGGGTAAMPSRRSSACVIGQLPGVAAWAWDADVDVTEIARDLSSARAALGEDARALLAKLVAARIGAVPFAGELGTNLAGADLAPLVAEAINAPAAALLLQASVDWNGEAEALARMSGYQTTKP